jgi:hypothetical protein
VRYPESAASILPYAPGGVPGIESADLANAATQSQTPTTLEVVPCRKTEVSANRDLTRNREGEALKQTNIKDPKVDAHTRKKPRRARGRGRAKAQSEGEDRENAPPPSAAREHRAPHRGHAYRGLDRAETGTRQGSRRGRPTNRRSRNDVKRSTTSQAVDGTGDGPDAILVLGSNQHTGIPKIDKANPPKPSHWASAEHHKSVPVRRSHLSACVTSLDVDEITKLPASTSEADVSTVQPLPSSTRRRAKEYFQRRTRERSVDTARRHTTRPSLTSASVVEGVIQSNVEAPRSQLDLNEDAKGSENPTERRTTISKGKRPDQFIFDPEASPFTPNATSSPRQASLSSIGVQSFSSPTPLPSHGNHNVAPLMLSKTSDRSIPSEIQSDSVPQLIPVTSRGIQSAHGLYSAGNQARAHLEAEQFALLRLQAYYNWLAGNISASGVGAGSGAEEHMDMSGGGGGLGGGVALGRPVQNRGRGKVQCRNPGGAYAHPKEHVVFSPRDHERIEATCSFVPQHDGERSGLVKPGKGDTDEKLKGEAGRPTQKWDGKWGLREVPMSGKEVGWKWGGMQ